MKTKNSGLTASGLSRPEIRPGDIFRDNHGSVITVTESAHNRVMREIIRERGKSK
ncbi:DUF4222 domain-containing protein [Salmonella enterica]|nr:DUF4222 domain-containing protein [Salmonella enterica]EEG7824494.1 DUF4222 domain-containing protein [Salmonella enterica]EKO4976928.1 DUF4222 domain-containing protein [Salmonella enterica]